MSYKKNFAVSIVRKIMKTKIGISATRRLFNMDRRWRKSRLWSNRVLSKYAGHFNGEVINVSGWKDSDKEGGEYRDYFYNASNYCISNYSSHQNDAKGEFELDLEETLPPELEMRFDVVFNHTTLEHVFLIETAFANLCGIAKDAVIVVVPFAQAVHTTTFFKDYWRFTPYCIEKLFDKNGFSMVVCECDTSFNSSLYLFCIGIRNDKVDKYTGLPNALPCYDVGNSIGQRCRLMEKVVYDFVLPKMNRLVKYRKKWEKPSHD